MPLIYRDTKHIEQNLFFQTQNPRKLYPRSSFLRNLRPVTSVFVVSDCKVQNVTFPAVCTGLNYKRYIWRIDNYIDQSYSPTCGNVHNSFFVFSRLSG